MLAKIIAAILALFYLPSPSLAPLPTPTPRADIEVIATGLEIPWAIAFLPDGSALVTERPGRLNLLLADHSLKQVATIAEVKPIGEGGLLGVAVDPNYSTNHYIHLYYTYQGNDSQTRNRVVRYEFSNQQISQPTTLVDAIPGAPNHNGGRLKFGPDGNLYITTGDALHSSRAQDIHSLAGKILRLKDNRVEVYSYGHRNPQGLAWDQQGQLWEVEHGPTAHDEINLIVQGQNYGWPTITGSQEWAGMHAPIVQSGNETWAPSGMVILNNQLFFAGLRGQRLYRATIRGIGIADMGERLINQFGRLRDVVVGPDKMLYVITSNRDGRGQPTLEDDRILRVDPQLLDKD